MKSDHDPFREMLAPICPRTWERPEHQRRLERELQEKWTMSKRSNVWTKAALFIGVFLAGGLAGASTLAYIEHYQVDETELPNGMRHVRVTDTNTGEVVMEDDIEADEGIFVMENEEGQDTLLLLDKAAEPDETKPTGN